jgi:catechol 2,3-dioxygenase-like lactoylglutathione lyase family enzyme
VIHHLALRVADLERARRFYSDLLGLAELRRQEGPEGKRSIWLDAGPVVLMLERELRGEGAPSGSGHLLALAVADLGEWEERLRAAGVAVLDRTEHTLYFRDPDGHRVGVSDFRFPGTR